MMMMLLLCLVTIISIVNADSVYDAKYDRNERERKVLLNKH